MTPYYQHGGITIRVGDCLAVMPTLDAESVDAIVCDPPYGLEFMGKAWDSFKTGRGAKYAKGGTLDEAAIAARSGKGGAGPSYVNRPAKRCRVCDKQAWSGSPCRCEKPEWELDNSPLHSFEDFMRVAFTEALRVAKPGAHLVAFGGTRTFHRLTCAIEDAGWEIRDCLSWLYGSGFPKSLDVSKAIDKAAGAEREVVSTGKPVKRMIPGADQNATGSWIKNNGREFMPIETKAATDAAKQWDGWGTALKPAWEPIILARKPLLGTVAANVLTHGTGALNVDGCRIEGPKGNGVWGTSNKTVNSERSFVGSPDAADYRTEQHSAGRWPANVCLDEEAARLVDEASGKRPTRFFYTAKASKADRFSEADGGNDHPTVKPLALMQWLCTLVTPPGGVILDPFMGSGSTLKAAKTLGFRATGIDLEERHAEIAAKRLSQEVLAL